MFFPKSEPTQGAGYSSVNVAISAELTVHLDIWDTSGQDKFATLLPVYYSDANVNIIVIDVTDPSSFETVAPWLDRIERSKSKWTTILVANKIDGTRKISKV